MANNVKYKPGDRMSWTNDTGEDVASGDVVVVGQILAVALVSIANGASGELLWKNFIAECPKVSGAVIAQGETLTWDVSLGMFDDNQATPATGDVTESVVAARPAGDGDEKVWVAFNGVAGTVA